MLTVICIAAQQGRRLADELADFGLSADEALAGEHADPARFIDQVIAKYKPDCVLVSGDGENFRGALDLFPTFGGQSTGLRLYELHYPDTGGTNGHSIDLAATRHFVFSESSRDDLLKSGIAAEHLFVTDSTEVDAALILAERIRSNTKLKARLAADFPFVDPGKRLIFVTSHHCDGQECCRKDLCLGLIQLARRPDVQLVFSLSADPERSRCASQNFAGQPGIILLPPLDHAHLVFLMMVASLILADPDDMPKGALSLNKPVLAMSSLGASRGAAGVEGGDPANGDAGWLLQECGKLLDDSSYYRSCSMRRNPFGDGHASQRIAETLLR